MTTRILRIHLTRLQLTRPSLTRLTPLGRHQHSSTLHCHSDDRRFLVLAPDLAQRVAHLADRRVGAHGVEDRRHQVLGRRRPPSRRRVERARRHVASSRVRFERARASRSCRSAARLVDVQRRRSAARSSCTKSLTPTMICSPALDRLLEAVGALGDLPLREAALDRRRPCRPCRRSGRSSASASSSMSRGQPLDEVRPAERIDDVRRRRSRAR